MMSNESVTNEREILIEFLNCYKECPCLWDSKDKFYTNGDARRQAWQILQNKLQKLDNNITISNVKKKVENMRSAYKREVKKIHDSKKSGSGADDLYVPSLWYFSHLTFLDEKNNVYRCGVETLGGENKNNDSDIDNDNDNDNADVDEVPAREKQPSKKRGCTILQKQEKLIASAQSLLSVPENAAETYGRFLGQQLAKVNELQRCVAAKLISEVLFYAELEKLTPQSTVVLNNPPVQFYRGAPPTSAPSYAGGFMPSSSPFHPNSSSSPPSSVYSAGYSFDSSPHSSNTFR